MRLGQATVPGTFIPLPSWLRSVQETAVAEVQRLFGEFLTFESRLLALRRQLSQAITQAAQKRQSSLLNSAIKLSNRVAQTLVTYRQTKDAAQRLMQDASQTDESPNRPSLINLGVRGAPLLRQMTKLLGVVPTLETATEALSAQIEGSPVGEGKSGLQQFAEIPKAISKTVMWGALAFGLFVLSPYLPKGRR